MEIINLSNKNIKPYSRDTPHIHFGKTHVYISSTAVEEFGLSTDLTINFIDDDDEWMFYADTNKDGFALLGTKETKALRIANGKLSTLFSNRTKCSLPSKFPLKALEARLKGNPLIKIEINKPITNFDRW